MNPLYKISVGDEITAKFLNSLVHELKILQGITVAPPLQIRHSGSGVQITLAGIPDDWVGGFWAKITGNAAADGTPQNRWKYAWSEVEKTSSGYQNGADGWTVLSEGRSGTTSTDPAYNSIENMNTKTNGVREGNGVDPAHIDTADYTFEIMPCTTDNIVWIHEVSEGENTEFWFEYSNGVDGTCD